MKALLTFAFAFLSLNTFSQTWIKPDEAEKQKGNIVNVMGFVTDIKYEQDAKGYTIFLQLSGKDSVRSLILVIRNCQRPMLSEPEKMYLHQYVQAKGKVEIYKGKPGIILQSENEISMVREAPELKVYEPL